MLLEQMRLSENKKLEFGCGKEMAAIVMDVSASWSHSVWFQSMVVLQGHCISLSDLGVYFLIVGSEPRFD